MKKLTIKTIIEFKGKSDTSKKRFAADLKIDKEKVDSDGGGDYWVTSLSALSNTYKQNNTKLIKRKKAELIEKRDNTENEKTKTMYQRNIDILFNYEDFDVRKWLPLQKIEFIKKQKANSILIIKEFQVQATPHHVFIFKKNETVEIGAIWFIAKLKGYTESDLGMFTDILYRYLKVNFSNDYVVNPDYCLAVDVVNCFDVNYSQIQKGEITPVLIPTINEIRRLM